MTRCVQCGKRIAKHKAFHVKVVCKRPFMAGYMTPWSANDTWRHSQRTWSAVQQAMLANTTSVMGGNYFPEPTHVIETYIGYACCREHAESAAEAKTA